MSGLKSSLLYYFNVNGVYICVCVRVYAYIYTYI